MSDENKEILDQVTELISSKKEQTKKKVLTRKLFKRKKLFKKKSNLMILIELQLIY